MRGLDSLASFLYLKASASLEKFMSEERGDTNFISILIILGVIVVLAGVFMGFGDDIKDAVDKALSSFLKEFQGFTGK